MPDPIIINPADIPDAGTPVGTDTVLLVRAGVLMKALASAFGSIGGGGGGTVLTTPTPLTATPSGSTQINLSWTNIAFESSYLLQWSPNGTSGWTTIGGVIAANTTSYSHTGLTASTAYYYGLKAVGDGVTYLDSAYATANAT